MLISPILLHTVTLLVRSLVPTHASTKPSPVGIEARLSSQEGRADGGLRELREQPPQRGHSLHWMFCWGLRRWELLVGNFQCCRVVRTMVTDCNNVEPLKKHWKIVVAANATAAVATTTISSSPSYCFYCSSCVCLINFIFWFFCFVVPFLLPFLCSLLWFCCLRAVTVLLVERAHDHDGDVGGYDDGGFHAADDAAAGASAFDADDDVADHEEKMLLVMILLIRDGRLNEWSTTRGGCFWLWCMGMR